MAKKETDERIKSVVIEGIITSARVGASRFDETVKNRLSIKSDTLPYDTLDGVYANSGERLTPKWLKDRTGYINLNSSFDIPVMTTRGRKLSFEEFCETSTALGSKVNIKLSLKEGAVYPVAFKIIEDGEENDPFADL